MTADFQTQYAAEIQAMFGDAVAGNHFVMAADTDGSVICYCDVEVNGANGRVYFIANDEYLSDYTMMTKQEALASVDTIRNAQCH